MSTDWLQGILSYHALIGPIEMTLSLTFFFYMRWEKRLMIWEEEVMKRDRETKDKFRIEDKKIKEKGKGKGKMRRGERRKGQNEKTEWRGAEISMRDKIRWKEQIRWEDKRQDKARIEARRRAEERMRGLMRIEHMRQEVKKERWDEKRNSWD